MIRETIIVHLLPVLLRQEIAERCFELLRQGYSLYQVLQNYPELHVYYEKDMEELEELSKELLSQEGQELLDEALVLVSRGILERQYRK